MPLSCSTTEREQPHRVPPHADLTATIRVGGVLGRQRIANKRSTARPPHWAIRPFTWDLLVGVAGFEPAASSSRTTSTEGDDQDTPASPQDRGTS